MRQRILLSLLLLTPLGLVMSPAVPAWALPGPRAENNRERPAPPRATSRIEREVRHRLLMLPYYSVFDNLEFRVEGYNVTLMGQVVWPTLKSDAEATVRGIEGVERIDNRIEVLPLSPFDNRIRRATYRAIFSDPVLSRYAIQPVPPIHIIVKNGHVTLIGVVNSRMESQVAYMRASGVPDVFSVTNRLRVEKG